MDIKAKGSGDNVGDGGGEGGFGELGRYIEVVDSMEDGGP